MRRSVIFDCDPGDDDAIALLMAFASPQQLDILGVTTSCGNVSVDKTFNNARDICALAGREDIRVFKGTPIPLINKPFYGKLIHGEEGLGGVILPRSQAPVERQHAVDFIIETLLNHHPKVTLAVTGPMTNIALAMIKEPKILDNIELIVMMGGARREKGNIAPCAEFNTFVDPHAAFKVLESFDNIVMVSLDVTHQVLILPEALETYKTIICPIAEAFVGLITSSMEADMKFYSIAGRAIHDACVTAYLLEPTLFSGTKRYVTVETKSEISMGQTVISWYGIHTPEMKPNCVFLDKVDARAVNDLIYNKIHSYSKAATLAGLEAAVVQ